MMKYETLEAKTEDLMHCTRTYGGLRCRVCFADNGALLGYVRSGPIWYPMGWTMRGTAAGSIYGVEQEDLALMCPAVSPAAFREQMEEYLDNASDVTYDTQLRVTLYMSSVLRENGYGAGCDIADQLCERWFS